MICSNLVKLSNYSNNLVHKYRNLDHLCHTIVRQHHCRFHVSLKTIPFTTQFFSEKNRAGKYYSVESKVHESETNDASNYLRHSLYPDSRDEIVLKLKSCTNADDVFDIIDRFENPRPDQLVQALLVLRDIYRIDFLTCIKEDNTLNKNSFFKKLVDEIMNVSSRLNIEELSCCILFFEKFNVDRELLLTLISTYEKRVQESQIEDVSLSSLARFFIVVKEFRNLWAVNTCLNFLPILRTKLELCDNYNDLRRLTTCFQKVLPSLLDIETMENYVVKCNMLMMKNEDPTAEVERLRTVVKCVRFLNYRQWLGKYSKTVRELLLSVHGRIHMLPTDDLHSLYSITYDLLEPYVIICELKSLAEQKIDQGIENAGIDPRSLALIYRWTTGKKDIKYSQLFPVVENYLNNLDVVYDSVDGTSYGILFELPANKKLINKYWNRVANSLECCDYITVQLMCLRYLNFKYKISYYNKNFELKAQSLLIKNREKYNVLGPVEKCILNSLLLYFNHECLTSVKLSCDYLLKNISRVGPRGNAHVSFILWRLAKRFGNSEKSPWYQHYHIKVLAALNDSAVEYLKTHNDIKLPYLIEIFNGYRQRGYTKSTELYNLIVEKLAGTSFYNTTSRKLATVISNFKSLNQLEPEIVEKMVQYFIEQKNVIFAFSAVKLLHYMFLFGYTPNKHHDEFIDVVCQLVIRDKDELPTTALIHAALSLCYYNTFPAQIAEYIFNIEFLQDLDKEVPLIIGNSRRRSTLQAFMELNRAACINFPNRDVTWFHEKYCRERITLESNIKSETQKQIQKMLVHLVKNENALEIDAYSPYLNKIDFLLYTNKKGQPVNPKEYKPQDLRKIAIVLNKKATSSPYYQGKGNFELLCRQLELLGYEVAKIKCYHWNSICMSEPSEKENYLCNAIWSK